MPDTRTPGCTIGGDERSTRRAPPPTLDTSVRPATDRDEELVAMADTTRIDTGRSAGAIMSGPPAPNRRPLLYIIIAVVVIALIAGGLYITTRKPAPRPAPQVHASTAPKTQPTRSPAEAAAANGALTAYRGFTTVVNEASQTADFGDPRLDTYIGGRLRREIAIGLINANRAGIVLVGRTREDVQVASVSLATQTVRLAGCSDISGARFIVKATGQAATAAGPKRFKFTAVAEFQQGRWLITQNTPLKGQPC